MKTGELWTHIETINSTNSRNRKRDLVGAIIGNTEPHDAGTVARLLVGDITTPEQSIGVGKKTVRKAIEKAFGVSHETIREHEKELGDLTRVPLQLDRPNPLTADREKSTTDDLQSFIYDICDTSSETQKISDITTELSQSVNPHVYVYALLCERGDYRIGVSWKTVRDACTQNFDISKDEFERTYGIGTEIDAIVTIIANGGDLPREVVPGKAIRPMLASSRDLPDDTGGWVADTKYDGGRLLIHRSPVGDVKGSLKAHTRQRRNIVDNLPEIHDVDWPDTSFVVDAEAVGYDPETGDPLPFQQFMERFQREKNVEEKAEDVAIGFKLFDVLYIDGRDVTEHTYGDRRKVLSDEFPNELVSDSHRDLDEAFEDAVEQGFEGIIAKDKSAPYEFQRSNAWRKLKPTKEPIDLRVTSVVPGTGRLAGTLGALRVETAGGTALGKVGTGFTDEERDELWARDDLVGSIVELEWEELQERDGSYGLRFPRFLRLRPEGEPDTLDRIESL